MCRNRAVDNLLGWPESKEPPLNARSPATFDSCLASGGLVAPEEWVLWNLDDARALSVIDIHDWRGTFETPSEDDLDRLVVERQADGYVGLHSLVKYHRLSVSHIPYDRCPLAARTLLQTVSDPHRAA